MNLLSSLDTLSKVMMATYIGHLDEPWFSLMQCGVKTVEGRLNKGGYSILEIGDTIEFTPSESIAKSFTLAIKEIRVYASFQDYLCAEGLGRCLPGVLTVNDGVAIYRKFYSEADEVKFGVKAFAF